jgi:hypothetical protein
MTMEQMRDRFAGLVGSDYETSVEIDPNYNPPSILFTMHRDGIKIVSREFAHGAPFTDRRIVEIADVSLALHRQHEIKRER